jgi:amylosucrase
MLEDFYTRRSESLKALDGKREADPDWYKGNNMLGMCLYVKPFAGNLNGVRKKLPYLKECGVNYLHLMPLLKSPRGRSDGGYAVSDFRTVEPELGTMADLKKLTEECHAADISVCMDFVMNHTSEDHEWARKARSGDPYYQDFYFFYNDWGIPSEYEKYVPQVFPTTAPGNFTWLDDARKIVLTTFYPYQWDLNYRNPNVFYEMTANMLFLANKGIDVIRIDAVPYIWKQLGTNCRNLPQVHTIVRMCRMITEIVCPGTLLLGEVVMAPDKLAPYFGTTEKPECHMLYNATTMCTTWNTVATRDVRLLRRQVDQVSALPKQYIFLNYLRCHDDIGWGLDFPWLKQFGWKEVPHKKFLNDFFTGKLPLSFSRGELYNDDPRLGDARLCGTSASLCGIEKAFYEQNEEALRKALDLDLMLHAFLLSQTGLPILYAGDEIGQRNDYSYHDDPEKWADSRYIHRGNFDWDLEKLRHKNGTIQEVLFDGLRKMEKIRSANPVFRTQADVSTFWAGSDSILAIRREYQGKTLIALFNFTDSEITAGVEFPASRNLMTGRKTEAGDHISLPGNGFVWYLY